MSFHDHLLAHTEAARMQLLNAPIIADAQRGAVSRADYVEFLTQAYHHVKHTVPLLMACGSRLSERLEWLREAIGEYIEEEIGHQRWILADIAQAGGDPDAVANGLPSIATELMVAYAYDGIQRGNPVSFFGMVLVLEGTSIALATQVAGVLESSLGLSRKAFTYLRSHGELDIEHTAFYASLMNRLSDPADQAAVLHSARVFYRLYGDIFRSLRDSAEMRRAAA
jgi:pyrroloquinoline quinone (PQQ) biosynthesis protein C